MHALRLAFFSCHKNYAHIPFGQNILHGSLHFLFTYFISFYSLGIYFCVIKLFTIHNFIVCFDWSLLNTLHPVRLCWSIYSLFIIVAVGFIRLDFVWNYLQNT